MPTIRLTLGAASAVLAAGTAFAAAPVATTAAPAQTDGAASHAASGYVPNERDKAQNQRLQKQLDAAIAKAAENKRLGKKPSVQQAVTVYYDDSNAPSFDSLIDQGASIWNSRVSNVKLVETTGSGADLRYYEGNDSRGSYYYGDGRGNGTIFLDYNQANTYAPLRIITHETGHALGLPDRYTQPCSKLMSGGGPGPSCTNPYPDSVEASEVNTLWANGFVGVAEFAKVG
ncbi:snapalysin family zinc-dependent metalloprotease [Knoellia koreensis]|nr:snapalysin family zinc-dependent metalloprotease [Knoellia sp. DB2414S]